MSYSSNNRRGHEPWRNKERHYCEICNSWMGSDRQSIMLHENGKKHREKVEESLQQKRRDKLQEEKQQKLIQSSLAKMEQAAMEKVGGGFASSGVGGGSNSYSYAGGGNRPPPPPPPQQHHYHHHQQQYHHPTFPVPSVTPSSFGSAAAPPPPPSYNDNDAAAQNSSKNASADEKKAWATRRKQREDEKRKAGDGTGEDEDGGLGKRKRIKIEPGQGHYSHDSVGTTFGSAIKREGEEPAVDGIDVKQEGEDQIKQEEQEEKTTTATTSKSKIYLEGPTFYGILEEDMPVQLWTGPINASMEEKRLVARDYYWKNALIVAVRHRRNLSPGNDGDDDEIMPVVHVAYLASPDDTEETMQKNVPVDRIRIILGADPSIPETLEEARLLAMGGEEIQIKQEQQNRGGDEGAEPSTANSNAEIDEATGFSTWSTVTIKRTTIRQEMKEERARIREKRKQVAAEQEEQKKLAEVRRMEEAKVGNADDSALGAYDVLGKGGYKGVNIEKEPELKFEDTAKRLASGQGNVAFKKSKFKSTKSKKQNRRTTSADDD